MSSRFAAATEYEPLLFFPAFLIGFLLSPKSDAAWWMDVAIVGAPPAAASLVLTLLILAIPSLAARGSRTYWLALTLPAAHLGLTTSIVSLASVSANPLTSPPKEFAPALTWLDPKTLMASAAAEMMLMVLVLAILRRRVEEEAPR